MSTTDRAGGIQVCGAGAGAGPVREVLPARTVPLGGSTLVRRLLPSLGRRMVGPWCFVDHYGPDDVAGAPGMQVPPHPHIGLQTVSWLLDGEVQHRDSLGSDTLVRPGQLALMTAGSGIAHSETSPPAHGPVLHGAQLWIALPDAARAVAPRFEHHTALPVLPGRGMRATVLLGDAGGARSPGRVHGPVIGLDVVLEPGADVPLPLEPDFEHAVLTVEGAPEVDGGDLEPGTLCYLGTARRAVRVRAAAPARFLLLGGEPFAGRIVMWWNFVARTGEEVAAARAAWQAEIAAARVAGGSDGRPRPSFGAVPGYAGPALEAPPLPPSPLVARPRSR